MIYVVHTSFDLLDFCIRDMVEAVTHSNLSTDAQYSLYLFSVETAAEIEVWRKFCRLFYVEIYSYDNLHFSERNYLF